MALTPNTSNTSNDFVAYYKADPNGEAKLEADLKKGDGNAVMDDLSKAVADHKMTKQQAADIGSQVQQYVNGDQKNDIANLLGKTDHTGGKIDKKHKQELTDALDGTEVVHGGKTRSAVHAANFFKGIGKFFQGLISKVTLGIVPPPSSGTPSVKAPSSGGPMSPGDLLI